jgi:tRNA threonylcarbamoyladenosine biosynthesis protein TsaE
MAFGVAAFAGGFASGFIECFCFNENVLLFFPISGKHICMNPKELKIVSASDQETIHIGQSLGACLKKGDVIGLVGELGSGKTWFTKGLIRGLGVRPESVVTSPSFALVNEYQGIMAEENDPGALQQAFPIFHMDLYRLSNLAELVAAGLTEYLDQEGVVIIEWAERWPEILPQEAIMVYFTILGEQEREIRISCNHPRHVIIMEKMKEVRKKQQCL